MIIAATPERLCFVYCGKPAPECRCLAGMQTLGAEFEAAIFNDLDSLYITEEDKDKQ
jgi:hypothetical protein